MGQAVGWRTHDVISLGAVLTGARFRCVCEGQVGGIDYTIMTDQRHRHLKRKRNVRYYEYITCLLNNCTVLYILYCPGRPFMISLQDNGVINVQYCHIFLVYGMHCEK